jgi:hypothetical protein
MLILGKQASYNRGCEVGKHPALSRKRSPCHFRGSCWQVVGQLLILHAGYLDVDVDAVQEGPGDVPYPFRVRLVAADCGVGAGALMYLITSRKEQFALTTR